MAEFIEARQCTIRRLFAAGVVSGSSLMACGAIFGLGVVIDRLK
jgi:hypothetical protein